jgi:hypothetical protein
MKNNLMSLLIVTISFCYCSDSTSPAIDEKEFGIYLLKDTLLVTSDAKKLTLESLQVQDAPIININDVTTYNWEEHNITLTPEAFKRFKSVEKKVKSVYGLPFIVMLNQQKIYLGNIYPMYSSYIHPDLPFISVAPFLEMRIERAPLQSAEDKRKDERIYTVLNKFNKINR